MKAIGIVRRIDDLGRIVIPKELRRSLGIQEGDALEIVATDNNGVFIQKCGEADEEDPMPSGIDFEVTEENPLYSFRDSYGEDHLVTLSPDAIRLLEWLESQGLLDEDSWYQIDPSSAEEHF